MTETKSSKAHRLMLKLRSSAFLPILQSSAPTPPQISLPIQHLKDRESIFVKLKEERKINLARNSALAKIKLLQQCDFALGMVRCPKCTLYLPCNHFKSISEVTIFDFSHTRKGLCAYT